MSLRHSIVRRSTGVTAAYLLGHTLSYVLVFGANRILDSGGFGLFYASLLAISVLMSPMMALTFVLGRRITMESARAGQAQAATITWRLIILCVRLGLPAVVLLGGLLAALGPWLGIEAWQILLLIPSTVLALAAAEILRVSLQSLMLFNKASPTLDGEPDRADPSVSFRTVWAGILGVAVGAASVSAAYAIAFAALHVRFWPMPAPAIRMSSRSADDSCLFAVHAPDNIDILIGYWLLTRAELDIYAASALLPKAIVTATFAVAQVVLPVVVEQRMDGVSARFSVIKAVGVVLGMSTAAGLVLWVAMPLVQTTPFAIRGLDLSVMMVLATGAAALSTLRILVVAESALQRHAIGLSQSAAVVLFLVLCTRAGGRAYGLAELHTVIVWAFLIIAVAVLFALRTGGAARMRSQAR